MKSTKKLTAAAWVAVVAGSLVTDAAVAAERVVLFEQFTATWCGYCPSVGRALHQLYDNYPDTVVPINIHKQDSYSCTWGNQRISFYSVGGIPTVWIDGVRNKHGDSGSDAANYSGLLAHYNARMAVGTDISIEMGAEEVSTQRYKIVAKVTLDEASSARTVRVQLVNTLWDYPHYDDGRYTYCAMSGTTSPYDVALEPGVPALIEHEFLFNSTSWAHQEDIAIAAFVQKKTTSNEISNSQLMKWPFPPPPSDTPEDINGDGTVDVLDLLELLSAWGTADPDADINADGTVDVLDLLLVLGAWS